MQKHIISRRNFLIAAAGGLVAGGVMHFGFGRGGPPRFRAPPEVTLMTLRKA
jgi:hypothetical protein